MRSVSGPNARRMSPRSARDASGAGKSSLLVRFTDDVFVPQTSTLGVDFRTKLITLLWQRVRLQRADDGLRCHDVAIDVGCFSPHENDHDDRGQELEDEGGGEDGHAGVVVARTALYRLYEAVIVGTSDALARDPLLADGLAAVETRDAVLDVVVAFKDDRSMQHFGTAVLGVLAAAFGSFVAERRA